MEKTFEVWFDVPGSGCAEIDGIYVDVDYDETDKSGKAWIEAEKLGLEKMERISAFFGWGKVEVSGCDFALDEEDKDEVWPVYKAVLTDEDGISYDMCRRISRDLAERICRHGGPGWAIVKDGVIV